MDLVERLHEAAAASTGLSEFGADDYLEGLGRLVAAIAEIPGIAEPEVERLSTVALAPLVGRLHSEHAWVQHRDCLATEVRGPLLITGMPRTGTTALHKLISQDEQFQVVESWLIPEPRVRPPRDAWPAEPAYRAALERADLVPVDLKAGHFAEPDEADECLALMAQTFVSNQWGSTMSIPAYDEWMLARDMRPSYRRYADNLRLIGADEPDRSWLLKNPSNVLSIDAFLDVFPDASVVQTHRDPLEAMTSLVSLLVGIQQRSGLDPAQVVNRELSVWAEGMRRMDDVRRVRPRAFYDVGYRQFVAEPVNVVRAIYEGFGFDLTPTAEAAMVRWVEHNPQGKHGTHQYASADFGITRSLIEEHFGDSLDTDPLREETTA